MLKGIRVLDLTRLLPGPYATQILADLGAEVIKIEEPSRGDYYRSNSPLTQCSDGNSVEFHAINRGKKSVALNLKNSPDKIKFHKLLSTSDVLVESFRPGVLKRLGFDPKDLLHKYKSLIICSISGYGQNGPLKLKAGHDINYISRAGLLGLCKTPSLPPTQIADLCGGAYPATLQIIAALYYRQKNGGRGNIIDVSMTDCSYALGVLPQTLIKNFNIPMSGGKFRLNGLFPCYHVYPCKNGYISVGANEAKFWRIACDKILNAPHLISKQKVTGKECDMIIKEITDIFMTKTCAEWETIIAGTDCCVEIVPKVENVSNDSHIKARDLDIDFEINGKTFTVPKSPLNMLYGIEFQNKSGPSSIGEHNNEIFSKL